MQATDLDQGLLVWMAIVKSVRDKLDEALECAEVPRAELETVHSGGVAFCAEQALTDCEGSSVRHRDVNGDDEGQISLTGSETRLDAEFPPRDTLGTPK